MKARIEPASTRTALKQGPGDIPDHINEGIEAIAALHGRAERGVTVHQRGIERLTGALGRPHFLYAIVVFVSGWMGANLAVPALGYAPFDPPPFHYLHIVLTLSALLMATVVLVTQDRQFRITEQRSHLDLQIDLLAEGKITKVIALLEELRRDLPNVRNRRDAEAQAMASRADPQAVSEVLEASMRAEIDASAPRAGAPLRDPINPTATP